jgi:hypothetical protein
MSKPPCQSKLLIEKLPNFGIPRLTFNFPGKAVNRQDPVVRILYLCPSDTTPRGLFSITAGNAAIHFQRWLHGQMGDNTSFALNQPIVETVILPHKADWYATNPNGDDRKMWYWLNVTADVFAITSAQYNDPFNIWILYVDADNRGGAVGAFAGVAILPRHDVLGLLGESSEPVCRWVGGLGHELGHCFGLPHPSQCENGSDSGNADCQSLMFLGYLNYPATSILASDRQMLRASRFIMPIRFSTPPFDCKDI